MFLERNSVFTFREQRLLVHTVELLRKEKKYLFVPEW